MMMRAVPDKVRFIILQGPSHASLSEGNFGTETLSCALQPRPQHLSMPDHRPTSSCILLGCHWHTGLSRASQQPDRC